MTTLAMIDTYKLVDIPKIDGFSSRGNQSSLLDHDAMYVREDVLA